MSSRQQTVDLILEQVTGPVSTRRMFGEFGLYWDGTIIAFVCDDQLFVKPTEAGRAFVGDCLEGFPYPGAKPHLLIEGDKWDDGEWLSELFRLSARELQASPKRTSKKNSRKKSG
jgi:TfoX/Sxy family transcriptional regulator of competence genes